VKTDNIKEIGIDASGRLCIFPEKENFSMIWRAASEVHWDNNNSFLYSPKPREWSYYDWFKHIIATVKDAGCDLILTNDTLWINIPDLLKQEIITE
jgi:hypothetical protein